MPMLHGSAQLSGAAQSLLALLFPTAAVGGEDDIACNLIQLQPGAGGANPIYVGSSTVSATSYGSRLAAPAGGIPPAPLSLGPWDRGGPVRLSEVFVIGTATEVLHVLYVWW